MPQWLVIGVSGVTCGGKTTLSQNLRDYFQNKQNAQLWQTPYTIGDVRLISQDDYFLPVDDRRHKWIDRLNAINFELLTALDMKQMMSDITWTMKGRYLVGDPMENIDFINEISCSTNFEHYSGTIQMPLMPPPTQMLHYHGNKLQQQQQQLHYQTSNHYYHTHTHNQTHHHHHTTAQHQQPQQQQQHNQRSQQTRQHHQQQQQQQQQSQPQRHSIRNANGISSNHSNTAGMKLRDCKVNILIIEGFMIFNQPELLTLCNIKFHFHLPYEKCYERRRQRTYDPPDVTGYFEMCVWPCYEKNFAEFRDRKDITFLNGEISKERIRDFAIQKVAKYVEERCDALMVSTTSATFATPPPHKVIGIHNGNNSGGGVKPCPMEQQ